VKGNGKKILNNRSHRWERKRSSRIDILDIEKKLKR
jgi:hypothetical protein